MRKSARSLKCAIMPIYEFYSPDSHKIYSFYARRVMRPDEMPSCPDGKNFRMRKMISRFSFTGRAKEPAADAGGDGPELDPAQERAMMRLASEMEGMSEDNPDPRALGKMMRRMMEITGQKAPSEMEEMLRRLESGEDPEKLEEEFGDAFEDFDPSGGALEPEPGDKKNGKLRRWRTPPQRDPVLYEMRDYL